MGAPKTAGRAMRWCACVLTVLASACRTTTGPRDGGGAASSRAVPTSSATRSAAPPASSATAEAPPAVRAPALFARYGDALMPLGCQPQAWAKGSRCIERAVGEVIELYPRIGSDPKTVTAMAEPIYMERIGELEAGLRMPGRTVRSERMLDILLGFATVGTPHPVRFTSAAARSLEKDAAEWCQANRCDGRVTSPMLTIAERAPSDDAVRAAERLTLRKLVKGFAAPPRIVSSVMFEVRIAGGSRVLLDVGVSIVPHENQAANFPGELHFLLRPTDTGFELLKSVGAFTYELGETGALLAAVDLDGDGTDELIVEWAYGEGRWYRFARVSGPELVVIGEFAVGS